MQGTAIAVELSVTQQTPHKSRRAELPHRAFQKYSRPQKVLRQTMDKGHSYTSWAEDNMRFHHAELGQQLIEPIPIIALAMTAPIEILPQLADDLVVEKLQTSQVAVYAKMIEIARQFSIQQSEQVG